MKNISKFFINDDMISPFKKRGREKIDKEIRDFIRQMVKENPTWRAPRIHGELLKLGFKVSERTVPRHLPKWEPDGDKIKKWMAFLNNHRKGIAAMDFFIIPTLFFKRLHCFFIASSIKSGNIAHIL